MGFLRPASDSQRFLASASVNVRVKSVTGIRGKPLTELRVLSVAETSVCQDHRFDSNRGLKGAVMKTIVVGYDESEPAKRALARAAELALAFDAKLIVTSVAPVLIGAAAARGIGPLDPADPPELHREELGHAAAFLEAQGLRGEYTVALGEPATGILDLAEARDADLIVVGTREAGLLERLIDPSVSGAVQRKAHCDVLIVH